MKKVACHCERKKVRSPEEEKRLIARLNRIEGQIRGIRNMVEEDAYCPDVLLQVSAARAAMDAFSRCLLEEHIRTCVKEDLEAGKEEAAEELAELLRRVMK